MAMPGIFRHMIKSGWCFAILRSRARHHDQYVRVSDCVCALFFKSCGTKMANLGKVFKDSHCERYDDDDDARL